MPRLLLATLALCLLSACGAVGTAASVAGTAVSTTARAASTAADIVTAPVR